MTFTEERVNEPLPGAPTGVIEAVKRGVVVATRRALNDTSLSQDPAVGDINVDMEYPAEKTQYPSVWVQFSLSSLKPSGMGMMVTDRTSGDTMQQYQYQGRVSMTLLALTSLERDRIADVLISTLAFSQKVDANTVITKGTPREGFSSFYDELADNPHLSITVNSDDLNPGGQSVTVGTPWDPDQIVYEDAYSFNVLGEFQLVTTNGGLYRITKVLIEPEAKLIDPGEWQ